MSYKVLYRKYRPDSFDSVVGQDYTVKMLKNAVISGKHAHAYIFTGPRGTGKTSSAKIFAKALNCLDPIDGNPCNKCESCINFKENPDIIEIDAASNNGVEEIRELINNVKLVPSSSKYKIYIIDEVHMLTTSAFNALLLTLEEPPEHVVFILATTDIQNVPITILSRCQRFDFKPISLDSLIKRLSYVCNEENIDITDDALKELSLISAGGLRDALGMLDQLSSDDTKITLDSVSNYFGTVSPKVLGELLTSIEENNVDLFTNILGIIKSSGTNYTIFIEKLIMELRKIAVSLKTGSSNHDFYFEDVYGMIFDLNECLCNININVDPYVLIEICLLKYFNKNDFITPASNISNNVSDKSINKIVENPKVINKKKSVLFDASIRVNNCFAECSKDSKNKFSNIWNDFINYILTDDKFLASLIADTVVLAASDSYVIISNSNSSTNDSINLNIDKLEKAFLNYFNNYIKFVALSTSDWKKEALNFKNNKDNGIFYSLKDDVINYNLKNNDIIIDENNIVDVAKDVFGTFEVQ